MDESIAILRDILGELRDMNSQLNGLNADFRDLTVNGRYSLREIADKLSKIEDSIKDI